LNFVTPPALCFGELSLVPDDPTRADRAFLDEVSRSRDALREQIRQSQITIDRSKELLNQMDEIIAKAEKKG
jgi:hypothetical protein